METNLDGIENDQIKLIETTEQETFLDSMSEVPISFSPDNVDPTANAFPINDQKQAQK